MGQQSRIVIKNEQLESFCIRNHIRKLSFFGSVLRDDFRPDSDVDVLVEFQPGHPVGFLKIAAMEQELSEMIGRKVDMRTPADLSRYFRQEVVDTAAVQYVET